jgi:hypothetical protein
MLEQIAIAYEEMNAALEPAKPVSKFLTIGVSELSGKQLKMAEVFSRLLIIADHLNGIPSWKPNIVNRWFYYPCMYNGKVAAFQCQDSENYPLPMFITREYAIASFSYLTDEEIELLYNQKIQR